MGPERKAQYLKKILDRKDETNSQSRKRHARVEIKSKRKIGLGRKGKISVGVQC